MLKRHFKLALLVFTCVLLFIGGSYAQLNQSEQHILVSLRMIGHKILLHSGDSTSRVLPIKKEAGRYKIQFEDEFQFQPEELALIIDSVIKQTRISKSYIGEVEQCGTHEVVYSFEIANLPQNDVLGCRMRKQSRACYTLFITLLDEPETQIKPANTKVSDEKEISYLLDEAEAETKTKLKIAKASVKKESSYSIFVLLSFLLLIPIALVIYFSKKKMLWRKKSTITLSDPNKIILGKYRFDIIHSELLIRDEKVVLSAKESDLLLLLYHAANKTVEREVILNSIWGDEGDYIGRTLDVFVSKLRKKLELDPGLKIVNIRGVGYKLVMG